MATTAGPALLQVGEITEDWTADAVFAEYSTAVDPIAAGVTSAVPIHSFAPELHDGGPSRLETLDLSADLGVAYPATSPGLLAAFCVLLPGEHLATGAEGTSELYYCLQGEGSSSLTSATSTFDEGTMAWRRGDFFVLPAATTAVHTGGAAAGAVLYRVTDSPLLAYLGATATDARFAPTLYAGAEVSGRLAEIEREPASRDRNRISVLLGNAATPQTLTVTHTLWAMFGVLPAGRVQRPHRHQSVALDLITACAPGCYSLIGEEIDEAGAIVDPARVDWEEGGAFVTPPGLWHSHHNESGSSAYLVPIQDAGLHTYLRSLDIRFVAERG